MQIMTEVIPVRFSPEQIQKIKADAAAVGLGASTYLRQLAITQPQTEATTHDTK